MNRLTSLLTLPLLLTPLAMAQSPPQPPAQQPGPGAASPGRTGGMRGPREHDARDGRMREEGGPEDLRGMRTPPGTWWRNPDVVARIGLAPDQVKRIDDIFLESRVQLIHMHASLEEEQLRLEPLLAAEPVNQQAAMAQIAKIADTRADLEKANAKMLLTIRSVLTADQWTRLQQRFEGPRDVRGMRHPAPPGSATPTPPQ